MAAGRIVDICRYPVKGLAPQALPEVALLKGQTLPYDRAWALEIAPGKFNPDKPRHVAKVNFAMLMRDAELAGLGSQFEETGHRLTLTAKGVAVASASLDTVEGRAAIVKAVEAHLGETLRGRLAVVATAGHSFSDVGAKCIHIVNLASVRALEQLAGRPVDPIRFRPNVIIDGLPAWSEFDWIAPRVQVKAGAAAVLKAFDRTARCAATNVDPRTGARDMNIPKLLQTNLGHTDFGIYAEIKQPGMIRRGDTIHVM